MPYYCCVPNCKKRGTGFAFPWNPDTRMQWIVAIKRMDPITNKLWEPSQHHKVCQRHFTEDDYVYFT